MSALPRSLLPAGLLLCGLASLILCRVPVRAETPPPGVLKDLSYREGGSLSAYEAERCRLDLYLPANRSKFPSLVWFHGGGLTAGTKDDPTVAAVARHFADSGVAVAAVNYRLSPKATFPAYIEDAASSFAWVKRHIANHGGNPAKVFVGGHSAGGYLALMTGLDPRYLKAHGLTPGAIAGLVPVAGQTLTHYSIREERGLPKFRIIADEAAPLFHVSGEAPPMLILYAENDMRMRAEENQLLAAALLHAGHTRHSLLRVAGHDHGSVGNDLAKPDDAGFTAVLRFISPPPE